MLNKKCLISHSIKEMHQYFHCIVKIFYFSEMLIILFGQNNWSIISVVFIQNNYSRYFYLHVPLNMSKWIGKLNQWISKQYIVIFLCFLLLNQNVPENIKLICIPPIQIGFKEQQAIFAGLKSNNIIICKIIWRVQKTVLYFVLNILLQPWIL